MTWGVAENQCSRPQMKATGGEGLWLYVRAYRWSQSGSDVASHLHAGLKPDKPDGWFSFFFFSYYNTKLLT